MRVSPDCIREMKGPTAKRSPSCFGTFRASVGHLIFRLVVRATRHGIFDLHIADKVHQSRRIF